MKRLITYILAVFQIQASLISCEVLDNDPDKHVKDEEDSLKISLNEVAHLLSSIPINTAQLQEVHDAVTSSSGNGYDEEYTMKLIFSAPGTGVGEDRVGTDEVTGAGENHTENCATATRLACRQDSGKTSAALGHDPAALKDLISEYVRSSVAVKGGEYTLHASDGAGGTEGGWQDGYVVTDADEYLAALQDSDIQIYWPYSERWDGTQLPVITYDPGYDTDVNIGYEVSINDDGSRSIREMEVNEELAKERPVWVVNRNDDADYISLEVLRKQNPEWGEGGGTIIVKPSEADARTRSGSALRTLMLKDLTMNRQYDSWLAGASEFFVKIGSVENFTASTEAELKIYEPSITDFMIVVKRDQVGLPQPFNAVLVSEWTEQLTHCALMITEDDGGTMTKWDCSAIVKVASKSYGFDISLPFNKRDDIVWRGQLSSRWIETNSNIAGRFGDLNLTFEVLEY